jgi:hypothetical protein
VDAGLVGGEDVVGFCMRLFDDLISSMEVACRDLMASQVESGILSFTRHGCCFTEDTKVG